MSTVNGFQVGSETLKYNYESLDNYNTPNFSTSSSTTYDVGDYVMYNGKLYKCTTATTGGTWVSGSWNEAVLSDDVSDLSRQLSDETTGLNTKAPVILETASGAIASFSDGADSMPIKKLVAQIEPVQDLHGYANPWPAGGGANFLPPAAAGTWTTNGVTLTSDGNGNYRLSGTSTASASFILDLIAESAIISAGDAIHFRNSSVHGDITVTLMADGMSLPYFGMNPANRIVTLDSTYEGAAINKIQIYSSGVNTFDIAFAISLEHTNQETAFSPYSNICPISGWTGADVTRTGKNLFDKSKMKILTGVNTRYMKYGVAQYSDTFPDGTLFLDAGNYVFSLSGTNSTVAETLSLFDATNTRKAIAYNNKNLAFSVSEAGSFYIACTISSEKFVSWDNYDIQLEKGSATDYVPYTGDQISVTFPSEAGTVYGCTITLNPDRTGTLVVDRITWKLTPNYIILADVNSVGSGCHVQFRLPTLSKSYFQSEAKIYCNVAYGTDYSTNYDNHVHFSNNAIGQISFAETYFSNMEEAKTWIVNNPIYISFIKQSVDTYQLTESEISGILTTLYGTNNIWADTGDVEVEYPADTKLYIDNKITQAIANVLNS